MASTTHITIRISPELKDKLSSMAKAERRTLSQFTALLIEDAVEQRDKREETKERR